MAEVRTSFTWEEVRDALYKAGWENLLPDNAEDLRETGIEPDEVCCEFVVQHYSDDDDDDDDGEEADPEPDSPSKEELEEMYSRS